MAGDDWIARLLEDGLRAAEYDVVVAGNYDHLELWNPTAWEKHLNAVEGSVEHAAERLAAHGS